MWKVMTCLLASRVIFSWQMPCFCLQLIAFRVNPVHASQPLADSEYSLSSNFCLISVFFSSYDITPCLLIIILLHAPCLCLRLPGHITFAATARQCSSPSPPLLANAHHLHHRRSPMLVTFTAAAHQHCSPMLLTFTAAARQRLSPLLPPLANTACQRLSPSPPLLTNTAHQCSSPSPPLLANACHLRCRCSPTLLANACHLRSRRSPTLLANACHLHRRCSPTLVTFAATAQLCRIAFITAHALAIFILSPILAVHRSFPALSSC